jgi:hypothetical protein
MNLRVSLLSVFCALVSLPASAEYAKVTEKSEFLRLISGKTLTRPLVKLQVTPDGRIEGRGARWDVTGGWSWQNGYFCRDLFWGGDALGYNCQEVRAENGRLRFTSDKGEGRTAVFRLD